MRSSCLALNCEPNTNRAAPGPLSQKIGEAELRDKFQPFLCYNSNYLFDAFQVLELTEGAHWVDSNPNASTIPRT